MERKGEREREEEEGTKRRLAKAQKGEGEVTLKRAVVLSAPIDYGAGKSGGASR